MSTSSDSDLSEVDGETQNPFNQPQATPLSVAVQNSSDIKVGSHLQYNGPVTIKQYITMHSMGNLAELPNTAALESSSALFRNAAPRALPASAINFSEPDNMAELSNTAPLESSSALFRNAAPRALPASAINFSEPDNVTELPNTAPLESSTAVYRNAAPGTLPPSAIISSEPAVSVDNVAEVSNIATLDSSTAFHNNGSLQDSTDLLERESTNRWQYQEDMNQTFEEQCSLKWVTSCFRKIFIVVIFFITIVGGIFILVKIFQVANDPPEQKNKDNNNNNGWNAVAELDPSTGVINIHGT